MSVVALIPARKWSKGIPGKNTRVLGGQSLLGRAVHCAYEAGIRHRVVTTDIWPVPMGLMYRNEPDTSFNFHPNRSETRYLMRTPELAQDDTPMIDVVKHAMACIPGSSEDIWVLLQPTQPFRTPAHIQAAIALLRESVADSVVSVVELPRTHSPDMALRMYDRGDLSRDGLNVRTLQTWSSHDQWRRLPARRQDTEPAFIRDGTVYAFRRSTVERYGNIYGYHVKPLLMAPEDTCELDTEQDWAEVERRWKERHG